MTNDQLTALLAQNIMGWTVGPERFMLGRRRWLPRWRFQPTVHLQDAFDLLKCANPQRYEMGADADGSFWARVHIADVAGEAHESSQAKALTLAIARAARLEVDL